MTLGLTLLATAACTSGSGATAVVTTSSASSSGSDAAANPQNRGADALATFATTLGALSVSGGELVPPFDPSISDYTMTSLSSVVPITVTARPFSTASTVTVNGAPISNEATVSLTLAPRQDIVVTVHGSPAAARNYTVNYMPADLPSYSVWSDGRGGAEKILLSPANRYLLAVDRAGSPLYYRSFPAKAAADFEQHTLSDGTKVYTGLEGTSYAAWTLGTTHVMDESFREIDAVTLLPNRGHGALPSEAHDFRVLGDRHYVAMTYLQRTVDLSDLSPGWSNEAQVMSCIVQEIDHGSVVFEWDSADYPSLYLDSVDGNAFGGAELADYLHLNSVDIDPRDRNFVFSLRHANAIIKVDRHTGQILWTLGGREDQFDLNLAQLFSHQHHVRVQADGSLLVFDNGNGAHGTRVISMRLDEANHALLDYRVVAEKPADEPPSDFMGSAFIRGATRARTIVGWGGWTVFPPEAPPSVTELVDGTPSWTLTFDSPKVFSYRAIPIE